MCPSFLMQREPEIRGMSHEYFFWQHMRKIYIYIKPAILLKIYRFEGKKEPQESFALISCTEQVIQPYLVISAPFFHSLLD